MIDAVAGAPWYANVIIYDITANGGAVYNFPCDDGWSNNPTMRNIGSGADGSFVNMTEAAWVEIPV